MTHTFKSEASGPGRKWRFTDSLCLVAVWLAAFSWIMWVTQIGHTLPYDAFRDTAWSQNMLNGQIWNDPSIQGATWWYAPAGPGLMAMVSAVSGQDTPDVHARSALWLNPLILVALFLLLRQTTGSWAALASAPLLLFGSLWWMTHIGAAMPSVQGTTLALMTLLAWNWCIESLVRQRYDHRQIVVRGGITGCVLALTAWWHPVCSIVAVGALGFHALGLGITRKISWTRLGAGLGSTGISSMILAAPIVVHLLSLPRRNPVPLRYIAPEMTNPDFAVGLITPGVGILAVIGLVMAFRNFSRLGWTTGLLGIALIGQMPAYLPWWQQLNLPLLVPHEFQWHGQLAVAALATIGLWDTTRFVAPYLRLPIKPGFRIALIGSLLLIGILAPATAYLQFGGVYLANLDEIASVRQESVKWIKGSTTIEAVIACPAPEAYMGIAGLTGRKCAALPAGHTNPSVDAFERLNLNEDLLATPNEARFLQAAARLDVTHVLVKVDSNEAIQRLRRFQAWPSLTQVFASEKENTFIFKISTRNAEF